MCVCGDGEEGDLRSATRLVLSALDRRARSGGENNSGRSLQFAERRREEEEEEEGGLEEVEGHMKQACPAADSHPPPMNCHHSDRWKRSHSVSPTLPKKKKRGVMMIYIERSSTYTQTHTRIHVPPLFPYILPHMQTHSHTAGHTAPQNS